jgi:Na+/melibiose symporter-like transporter
VRAGVSSGASTLSWLTFLPIALLFGWLSRTHGVQAAGWLLVAITAVTALLLFRTSRNQSSDDDVADSHAPAMAVA